MQAVNPVQGNWQEVVWSLIRDWIYTGIVGCSVLFVVFQVPVPIYFYFWINLTVASITYVLLDAPLTPSSSPLHTRNPFSLPHCLWPWSMHICIQCSWLISSHPPNLPHLPFEISHSVSWLIIVIVCVNFASEDIEPQNVRNLDKIAQIGSNAHGFGCRLKAQHWACSYYIAGHPTFNDLSVKCLTSRIGKQKSKCFHIL